MSKPLLAIGVPSNRPLATSRQSLDSAIAFCRKNGYQLCVSDNSQDEEKAAYLREVMQGDHLTYIQSPPCGMIDNWQTAFDATSADYILMMGDDDTIFGYEKTPELVGLGPDVVGVRPSLIGYTLQNGTHAMNNSTITAPSGPERIIQHFKTSGGMNMGIFTFWRRDVFKSVTDLWFRHHPTRGTYCDWAIMCALVASGRVVSEPASCYFYNLQNWAGSNQHIEAQVARAFTHSGLPAEASVYLPLLNAIDSFILINRQNATQTPQDRILTAYFALDHYLKVQLKDFPETGPHPNAAAITTHAVKIARAINANDFATIFAELTPLLDLIAPDLGKRYVDYHLHATGQPWGAITLGS